MQVAQSCPILGNPMDCSLPGSPVHGILQARILEWFAIPSSRYCPNPGIKHSSPALQVDSLPSKPPEKPTLHYAFCQMNLAPCSSPSGTMIVTMLYSSFSKTWKKRIDKDFNLKELQFIQHNKYLFIKHSANTLNSAGNKMYKWNF